jgi:DNA-binding response OmpR family regulator
VGLDAIEAEDGEQALAASAASSPTWSARRRHAGHGRLCRVPRNPPAGTHSTVPIIMVTGGDELESVTSAYEAGATDFVSKPINWPILGHRVLYVLRASDAISRLRIADAAPRRAGRHPRHLLPHEPRRLLSRLRTGPRSQQRVRHRALRGPAPAAGAAGAIAGHMLEQVHNVLASSTSARSTTNCRNTARPRTRRRACGAPRAPFRSAAGGDRAR